MKTEKHFVVVVEFNEYRITTDCYDDLERAIKLCDEYYTYYSKTYKNVESRVDACNLYVGGTK